MEDKYYVVDCSICSFDTCEQAVEFREKLEEVICQMPEFEEYAMITNIKCETE